MSKLTRLKPPKYERGSSTIYTALFLLISSSFVGIRTVFAHTGQPIAPHDFWNAWNSDFTLLCALELSVGLYLLGVYRLWSRKGINQGIPVWRCVAFLAAIFTLVLALVSPLDALSGALFSAHMVQHLILIFATGPLLLISYFPVGVLWALPRQWAHTLGQKWNQLYLLKKLQQCLKNPKLAWVLFGFAFWVWHIPTFYQAALQSEAIHSFEHVCYLVTGMLFWQVLFRISSLNYANALLAVPYLFSTALHSGILGALMTFSSEPWYPFYSASARLWGLTPIQDQQLAGTIMWLPTGTILAGLSIFYFAAWLRAMETQSKSSEKQVISEASINRYVANDNQ
jgi:putative membrane protein